MKLLIIRLDWNDRKRWWLYTVINRDTTEVMTVAVTEMAAFELEMRPRTSPTNEALGMARWNFEQLAKANAPRSELIHEATREATREETRELWRR